MVSSLSPTIHEWKPLPKKFEAEQRQSPRLWPSAPPSTIGVSWDSRIYRQQNAGLFSMLLIASGQSPMSKCFGVGSGRVSIVSFNVKGRSPQEVELALDREGVIVRSATLNARISMARLGLSGAVRTAFMFYNTEDECDPLCATLRRLS
jgi:selenocysteine lyase/cysteine desulfurase